jgi:hypothetical protein
MELGGVDIVSDRLASHTAHRQVHFSHLNFLFSYITLLVSLNAISWCYIQDVFCLQLPCS